MTIISSFCYAHPKDTGILESLFISSLSLGPHIWQFLDISSQKTIN